MTTPALWRYLPPAFGALAMAAAIQTNEYLIAALAAILVGLSYFIIPRHLGAGLNVNNISFGVKKPTSAAEGIAALAVVAPVLVFSALTNLEFFYFHPLVSAAMASPFYAAILRNRHTRVIRSSHRRARSILADPEPVTLTQEQRNVLRGRDTARILTAMVTAGAIVGTQVATKQLARLSSLPTDRVIAAAQALEAQRIIHINSIMGPKDPEAWFFEIPARGLHILAAAQQPPALDQPNPQGSRALD